MLSAVGKRLVDRARLVLRDFDALGAAARALGDGVAGRVEVAATSSSGLEPVTASWPSSGSGTRASR